MTHKAIPTFRQFQTLLNFRFLPQSWRQSMELITSERFQPYFVMAFTLWLVGAVEIIQKTAGQRLDPHFWMFIALVITTYTGIRVFRLSPVRSHASRSKRSTAADAMVNRIVRDGFTVHHEENGSGRYIVVAPGGIYAMEVKARNVFGSRTVEFGRENELVLGGRISDLRPVTEAKAAAEKIRERLHGVLPTKPAVKPLVVFLNEWRINGGQNRQDVAVVNEKELQQYFSAQETIFDSSDLAKISACLN